MRRLSIVLAVVLMGAFPTVARGDHTEADPSDINNVEQRVTDHAFRAGADQDKPDVGGDYLVWRDKRGTSDSPYAESETAQGHIWSKNLSTRDELAVATDLATDDANPRVGTSSAGTWVVWTDHTAAAGATPSNDDIYACQLPCTTPVQVTTHPAHQMNPAIHGTTVVWEDYRNDPDYPDTTTGSGADLFMKDLSNLAAPETAVVEAPGNQTSPSVFVSEFSKGSTTTNIAWRDSRDVFLPAFDDSDVWVQVTSTNKKGAVTSTTTVEAFDAAGGNARSLSAYQVAVSDNRLLWNEKGTEEAPTILKTCTFTATGCSGAPETVDSGGFQITDLDLSGSQAVWTKFTDTGGHAYTRDLSSTSTPIVEVDDVELGDVSGSRVDGSRFVWTQRPGDLPFSGSDIFWRDAATQPQRANSISLGAFGGHAAPAADGDLVVYRRGPTERPGTDDITEFGQVWATDLSASSDRHFAVANTFGTDHSRPAIVGDRVVWSDCTVDFNSCGPVFERDLSVPDEPPTDLSQLGPPDADGTRTAWRCGDTEICVHDGDDVEFFDVSAHFLAAPTAPAFSVMTKLVRISGDRVVWHEFVFDPDCDPDSGLCSPVTDARLHVLDVATSADVVIAEGPGLAGSFGDFDIAGSTVVFASEGQTIHTADATGACDVGAPPCPEPLVTQEGHMLSSPSIDDTRVAWVATEHLEDCCAIPDIYTTTLGDGTAHLVTNELPNAHVLSPYVDAMGAGVDTDDRIYWVDHRNVSPDIFVESLDPSDIVTGDSTPPGAPTDAQAAWLGTGVEVSWTNPGDADFYRVRILRKSGSSPPSGIGDVTASVVYEGSGTTFTDTDVVPGVTYSYAVFAFDHEPNFSAADTAST